MALAPPELISVGTAVASANSVANPTSFTPGLPATRTNGDVLILLTTCRSSTPTVATPAGWTSLLNVAPTNGRIAVFGRPVDGSETAPTVTWSGMTTGTSGTPAQAQIACFRGLIPDMTQIVDAAGTASNQAASTTAAAGGAAISTTSENNLVLVISNRLDDAGTWSTLAASDTITWAKVTATAVTTAGADKAQEWQYGVRAIAGSVAAKTLAMTGATSFASSGVMLALASPRGLVQQAVNSGSMGTEFPVYQGESLTETAYEWLARKAQAHINNGWTVNWTGVWKITAFKTYGSGPVTRKDRTIRLGD